MERYEPSRTPVETGTLDRMEVAEHNDGPGPFDVARACDAGPRIDQATASLRGAVEALRMVPAPLPSELSECFGALGELLRRVDHTFATMASIYELFPVDRLRDDRGGDPPVTLELVTEALDDLRRHLSDSDSALQRGHTSAARLASLD